MQAMDQQKHIFILKTDTLTDRWMVSMHLSPEHQEHFYRVSIQKCLVHSSHKTKPKNEYP